MKNNKQITDDIIKDYSINNLDNNINTEDNKKTLIIEFKKNKEYAKSYRAIFEQDWRQIDAYLWNDIHKIAKKRLRSSFGSTNNVMLPIFNRLYANIITSSTSEGISITPGYIDKKVLDFSNQNVNPEDQQDQDIQLVDYLLKVKQFREVLKFHWDDLNIDEINKNVLWDYLIYGTGVSELYWDELDKNRHSDGDLKMFYVPLFSFFLEPGVINWQDSRYVITSEQINLLNLQRIFNLSNNELKKIADTVGVNGYSIDQNITQNTQATREFNQTVPYYRYFKKYLNKNNELKISCSYFAGNDNPYLLNTIPDIGIDQFPFEVLFSYKKPTESYGQSIFKFLIPAQKMIIQQDATIQARSVQAANPLVLISEQANINIAEISQNGGVKLGQTIAAAGELRNAVLPVKINEIPQDLIGYISYLQNNMNLIANTTEATMGQQAISGTTTGAVQQNLANANLPFRVRQSEVQTYYQNLIRLMVKFLVAKQATTRQIVLKDNTSSTTQYLAISYDINDFQDIHKNLKITVKGLSAEDVEKQRQLILQLWQLTTQYPELQGAVTAIDVIRAFHLPNEDEMIANIQIQSDIDYNEIATQIVGLIQQNDQLAVQAQQQQAILQSFVQSGEVNQEDAQKRLESIPQPLDPNKLVEIIEQLIKTNPARALENEKQIQAGALNAKEQNNGE